MKPTDAQRIEESKAAFLAAHTKRQTKAAFLCLLTIFVIFVLPRFLPPPFNVIAMAVGGAMSFSAYFFQYRQSLRTRKGSLAVAYCLLTFVWLCAVVVTFMSLTGKIE